MSTTPHLLGTAPRQTVAHVHRGSDSPWNGLARLLWKDYRMVRGLVLFGLLGTMLLMLAVGLCFERHNTATSWFGIWILMPNLVALGIGPLLVGNENEQSNFDWLRTLPISWCSVVFSKCLVGLVAWGLVLLGTTLMLWIGLSLIDFWANPSWGAEIIYTDRDYADIVFYSISMLVISFTMAFAIGSPVGATTAMLPAMLGHTVLMAVLTKAVTWLCGAASWEQLGFWGNGLLIGCRGVYLLSLVGLLVCTGRHRLVGTPTSAGLAWSRLVDKSHRHSAVQRQPPGSVVRALYWQQYRQTKVVWIGVLAVTTITAFSPVIPGFGYRPSLFMSLVDLTACALALLPFIVGVATFYGDRHDSCRGFFSVRGVNPTLVWWTRIAPMSLAMLVVSAGWYLLWYLQKDEDQSMNFQTCFFIAGAVGGSFLIGVSVGQWIRRPALAFFAAPLLGGLIWIAISFVYGMYYPEHAAYSLIGIGVIVFATWRMTAETISEKLGPLPELRGVGYFCLGLFLMVLAIQVERFWTMPSAMPKWRKAMLAKQPALPDPVATGMEDFYKIPRISLAGTSQLNAKSFQEIRQRIEQELSHELPASQWLSYDRLVGFLADINEHFRQGLSGSDEPSLDDYRELHRLILVASARRCREGRSQQWPHVIEELEATVADQLLRIAIGQGESFPGYSIKVPAREKSLLSDQELLDRETFISVVDQLPSRLQRQRSRIANLLNGWQQFQVGWGDHGVVKSEGGYKLFYDLRWTDENPHYFWGLYNPIERLRVERLVDVATRLSLEQLENGLPAMGSQEHQRIVDAWEKATRESPSSGNPNWGTPNWSNPNWGNPAEHAFVYTSDLDDLIDRLREVRRAWIAADASVRP